ncbi:MAG: Rrf2 family transcriptional regulator [Ornithinimicrobium sp.]
MRISAKADYAVRALLVLARADPERVTADQIAQAQDIPPRFLEAVLGDLRRAGLVTSQRGRQGGHRLSRCAKDISLGQAVRGIDGPLVFVNGERPPDLDYREEAKMLLPVWVAVRVAVRRVLDEVSLADLRDQRLPDDVRALVNDPQAWSNDP